MTTLEQQSGLGHDEFIEQYSVPRKPVILTDATKDWAALGRWTPDLLVELVGDRAVPYRGDTGDHENFRQLAAAIMDSTEAETGPYMENVDIERDLPELWADVQPRIPYATPDWKSSPLLPSNLFVPKGMESLFFGGQGAGLKALHYDYYGLDAFLSQIYGTKDFIVFAPEDGRYLYPHPDRPLVAGLDDAFDPDRDRFPDYDKASPIRFTLEPGQTLFVPNGWWHATSIPEPSLTVITQTWNAQNWGRFVRQTWADAWRQRRPVFAGVAAYLTLVWPLLRLTHRS